MTTNKPVNFTAKHLALIANAAETLRRFPVRSVVILLCLTAILTPFLAALAIGEGLRAQADISIEQGADLYLTGDLCGKFGVLPLSLQDKIRQIDGVTEVVPRIIGRTFLAENLVVVAGIPREHFPPNVTAVSGRLPENGEAVVGQAFFQNNALHVGDTITFESYPGKFLKISGVFSADSSLWSSQLVFCNFETAADLFGVSGQATDFAVYCKKNYSDAIYDRLIDISRKGETPRLYAVTRQMTERLFTRGYTLREGIYTALFCLAFALAVPALLVASGFGMTERRKEISIMKATGWRTGEVLETVFFENLILSLTGAALALTLAFVWLKVFNGIYLAKFFIVEIPSMAAITVPSRFLPLPAFLGLLLSLLLTLTGSLWSAWRSSIAPPAAALR